MQQDVTLIRLNYDSSASAYIRSSVSSKREKERPSKLLRNMPCRMLHGTTIFPTEKNLQWIISLLFNIPIRGVHVLEHFHLSLLRDLLLNYCVRWDRDFHKTAKEEVKPKSNWRKIMWTNKYLKNGPISYHFYIVNCALLCTSPYWLCLFSLLP